MAHSVFFETIYNKSKLSRKRQRLNVFGYLFRRKLQIFGINASFTYVCHVDLQNIINKTIEPYMNVFVSLWILIRITIV